jgi:hypothetical protein
MAFKPENRYSGAAEFGDDLGRFLAGENPRAALEAHTVSALQAPAGFRLPYRLIAASVLLALTAAAAWYSREAARFEGERLRSFNLPNTSSEAVEHLLDALEAQGADKPAEAAAALNAARKLLPHNEKAKKLAGRLGPLEAEK